MNSRERVIAALFFQHPDRVPLMHRTLPGAFRAYGEGLEALYRTYPSDVLLSPTKRAHFGFTQAARENAVGEYDIVDEWGSKWRKTNFDYTGLVYEVPIKALEDYRAYELPDPRIGIEGIEEMGAAMKADGGEHYVICQCGMLWHRLNFVRGYEESCMDLAEGCEEFFALRDRIVDHTLERIRLIAPYRPDGMLINDDWGTQTALQISPAMWREHFKPSYQRICDAIHEAGCRVHFHTDGYMADIIEDFIEIGIDEVNPQVFCMDMDDLSRRFNGRICFRADLDRQRILPFGTPEEVAAHVRRAYQCFGTRGGGYIGYGQIGTDVPLENAEAMLRAIAELPGG